MIFDNTGSPAESTEGKESYVPIPKVFYQEGQVRTFYKIILDVETIKYNLPYQQVP